jgi:hypothetical protein
VCAGHERKWIAARVIGAAVQPFDATFWVVLDRMNGIRTGVTIRANEYKKPAAQGLAGFMIVKGFPKTIVPGGDGGIRTHDTGISHMHP